MSTIKFDKEQKTDILDKLKKYCEAEFDLELGQFEAEFFLDFISDNIGNHYYNKALIDAQQIVTQRTMDITDAIDEMSRIT
ncbi:DUF2164 domain-containing protein [Aliamphritea ceti]|uniref:DUF2164 domain-containing protein n=1 Tax=Aliamphritea ceti TaxID=1524258 RepID=UPI0021C37DBD|nr:DUF2164 domain-containing protein [Aliamphritea ceti]